MTKYCYSYNGEIFDGELYQTREEAIKEGAKYHELEKGQYIYTGITEKNKLIDYFDIYQFQEALSEAASEHAGEASEGWPFEEMTKVAEDDLLKRIEEWAELHNLNPRFFGVKEIEKNEICISYCENNP